MSELCAYVEQQSLEYLKRCSFNSWINNFVLSLFVASYVVP